MQPGEQYVCLVCGYNMAGYLPDRCPFCGAPRTNFITSEECSRRFRVMETPVTDSVSRLNSTPRLGIEHAAYRIRSGDGTYWIDCPSCFDTTLPPMDTILFTHFHFLGASNQYRDHCSSEVWIHQADSQHELCRGFTFDTAFQQDFSEVGIEAHHIDGHTPGFTCYFFEDVFFMCDYVFSGKKGVRFNPYGPVSETVEGGYRIRELLRGRDISTVCAVDYVMDFDSWSDNLDRLLAENRSISRSQIGFE